MAERTSGCRAAEGAVPRPCLLRIHLAAKHPDVILSCLVTGTAMLGFSDREASLARFQLRAWDRPWFWKLQALAFRVPADSRQAFVAAGMGVRKDTAQRMYFVDRGLTPPG